MASFVYPEGIMIIAEAMKREVIRRCIVEC